MNFDRIATGLDAAPLLAALDVHSQLWGEITVRQSYPGSAHHDTECIFVRGPRAFTIDDYFNDLSAFDFPLPAPVRKAVDRLIDPLLRLLGATEFGRVLIVRLAPGGTLDQHTDDGLYAEHYSRFHVALQAAEGSTLTVEDESTFMQPGEAWWFDHRKLHSARNDSQTPRIHVIFDAVTNRYPAPRKGAAYAYPL
jgi:hypothetical protein